MDTLAGYNEDMKILMLILTVVLMAAGFFLLLPLLMTGVGFAFAILVGLVSLLGCAFWIWMLIDAISNNQLRGSERVLWVVVVWLLPFIGSVIYFLAARNRTGRVTWV